MKQKINECLKNNLVIDNVYSRKEIEVVLLNNNITIKEIPNITSLTYNQWNKGMGNNHLNPNFEYLGRNSYKFLSTDYPYTGDLFNNEKGSALIKIGYWIDGNLFDYNNQLSNFKFDFNILGKNSTFKGDSKEFLESIGFIYTGKYYFNNGKVEVSKIYKERVPLVYVFVIENKVYYVGQSVQGLSRPFNYHKFTAMKAVTDGINENVLNSKEVLIYTLKFKEEDCISWKGLSLNLIVPIEQALIIKFLPEWNKYKPK